MDILLTNDDGFGSIGIVALEKALMEKGHSVYVIAPDKQRSASSHSVDFRAPSRMKAFDERHYASEGSPADCILSGIARNPEPPVHPDLVISGINKGLNASTDIFYSGTCSAAKEAVISGYRAIAISAESSDAFPETSRKAASFLAENLSSIAGSIEEGAFININVPESTDGRTWEIGSLSYFEHRDPERPEDRYFMAGHIDEDRVDGYRTDLCLCANGVISITPISVSPALSSRSCSALGNQARKS